jgi:hypothetical protein
MNDFTLMKVSKTGNELATNFPNSINYIWASLLPQVHIHVFSSHEFHDYVEFPRFMRLIKPPHEVFIFYDVGVQKILGNAELSEHFSQALFSQLLVVCNLARFINKLLSSELFDLHLENFGLSSCS